MLLFQSILVYGLFALVLWSVASNVKSIQSPQSIIQQDNKIPPQYWCCILLFCLVSGLRWDVGVDHISYVEDYIDMCKGQYFGRERGIEPAYLLISQAFAQLGVHYIFYMALLAFLEIYFIVKAFKDEKTIMPYILILIVLGGYYFSWMNGIRQNIAACAFVWFSQYINKKNFWKYLICVILAYTMHTSALLLIPVYLLAYDKHIWNRTWLNISVFILCFIVGQTPTFVSNINSFASLLSFMGYDYYTELLGSLTDSTSFRSFSFGPRMLVSLLTYCICILLYGKVSDYYNSPKVDLCFKLFFIGVCWYYLFINTLGIFLRPNYYFIIFALPITAYTLQYLYRTKRSLMYTILLFLSLSFNFISCYADYNEPDKTERRSQLYQFCFDHMDGK